MDKWRQSSVRNDRVYKLTDHVTSVISKNGYVMIEGGETDQLFPGDRNIVFSQSINRILYSAPSRTLIRGDPDPGSFDIVRSNTCCAGLHHIPTIIAA